MRKMEDGKKARRQDMGKKEERKKDRIPGTGKAVMLLAAVISILCKKERKG